MSGDLGIIDIILFGMLAAFLIYRLASVLGKRTGQEKRNSELLGNRKGPDSPQEDTVVPLSEPPEEVEPEPTTPLDTTITQIKIADAEFEPVSFLNGARGAFEMIVDAYAKGDTETLNGLLSTEVYGRFSSAIFDRGSKNLTHQTSIIGIDDCEIIDAELEDGKALITVKYTSQQINVTTNDNGEVVDGDPKIVDFNTDIWTYERILSSANPNWTLVATRSTN